jgi:DNA polymerase-3 subunit alpha
MDIEVTAPDINESGVDFTPLYKENDGKKGMIRFGLAAVKGVGEKAVEQLIIARNKVGQFQSLFHFCENVDTRAANKQVMESLIKAGAFDRLGGNRAQMIAGLQSAMEHGADTQTDKLNGQMRFFGQAASPDYSQDQNRLPYADPWPEQMMLMYEKEVLGFYVTSNPLSHCAETINIFSNINTTQIAETSQEREVTIGGLVSKIRYNLTKTGKNAGSKMAVFSLLDLQGQVEVVLFPNTLNQFAKLIANDKIIFVKGRLDFRREKPNVIASEIIALDEATDKLAGKVRINLDAKDITKEKVAEIKTICQHHRGRSTVYVAIRTDKGKVFASADRGLSVNPDPEFCRKIRHLLGHENLQLTR